MDLLHGRIVSFVHLLPSVPCTDRKEEEQTRKGCCCWRQWVGSAGGAAVSQLQQKAGWRELGLCLAEMRATERIEEEGAADWSGSVRDVATDGEDRLRWEWGGGLGWSVSLLRSWRRRSGEEERRWEVGCWFGEDDDSERGQRSNSGKKKKKKKIAVFGGGRRLLEEEEKGSAVFRVFFLLLLR